MNSTLPPLIAGAGPVGLAAALFLARDGTIARIIDSADGPSPQSKALAVNPRTLDLLEPTGITAEMLAIGKPIHGARMWRGDEVVAEVTFSGLHHKYPYLLALSQGVTVRLLEAALNRAGINVERNLALLHCHNRAEDVEAELSRTPDGTTETVQCPWLLAADGAHSVARRELAIPFEGSSFEKEWHLLDVPLEASLAEDFAHVYFQDDGFLFLIRVIDGPEKASGGDRLWRLLGNFPDLLGVPARPAGPPVWKSSFHISHRINDSMQQGKIYFAGDAAHIHSPIGARGMNLGIEDAWVFSRLLKENQLSRYGDMRRKVDRRVVKRIELISRLARGESAASRFLRATAMPLLFSSRLTRGRMIQTLTGLDHPLDLA